MEPQYTIDEPSTGDKIRHNIIELIQFLGIVFAIFIMIRFFIAEPHKVSGSSMVPNFHDGDYIITNKLAVRFESLQRGEVIILKNPRNTDVVFIKRIIGFPGDKIKITDGRFYVNEQVLDEPYLPSGTQTYGGAFLHDGEEILIPDNQYFVSGDNRSGSSDSRDWGPVQKDLIIGQAWLRYWPVNKAELIPVDQPSN